MIPFKPFIVVSAFATLPVGKGETADEYHERIEPLLMDEVSASL